MLRVSIKKSVILSAMLNLAIFLLCSALLLGITVLTVSCAIKDATADKIVSVDKLDKNIHYDCVLILGAGLKSDGTPSHMLEDRIKVGVEVFNAVNADFILMSGDNSGEHYNEPAAMKKYAEELLVDSSKIKLDNEGFSTLESIVRASEVFGCENIIVITQEYHLHRAIYIGDKSEMQIVGVSSDLREYRGQLWREIREILARFKDFYSCK